MRQVGVRAVEPGMVLARDVRNFQGQVLLRAGVIIDPRHLGILKAWGVERLDIEDAAVREGSAAMAPSLVVAAAAIVRDRLRRSDLGHPLVAEIGRIASGRLVTRGRQE